MLFPRLYLRMFDSHLWQVMSGITISLWVRSNYPLGDFEEVYGDDDPDIGLFDAILTCFFIDTVSCYRLRWTTLRYWFTNAGILG